MKDFFNSSGKPKSKLASILFAVILGSFGIHNFYLGFYGKAIIQLLITVISRGDWSIIPIVWSIIEAIFIFVGTISKDAYGNDIV